MSNAHLKRECHKIRGRENAWWYEEARGIEIYVRSSSVDTQVVTIPWRAIRFALARKDRKP